MHLSKFSVGLTGGIGSGKTTVANFFSALGVALVDTDLISHALTSKNGAAIEALRAEFGHESINSAGAMDRAKMRDLVFSEPSAKKRLENILHPMIRQECEAQAKAATSPYIIFVVPLLIESGGWHQRVGRILVVDCEETSQIERVMLRSSITKAQVSDIMRTQATRQDRLRFADDIVDSECDLSQVRIQVEKLHQKYLNLALST
jgi:dephospho-CoA kinase